MWLPLVHPATGDLACNPGMCPDWESIQRPFGSQAGAEPHQSGFKLILSKSKYMLFLPTPAPPGFRQLRRSVWVRELSAEVSPGYLSPTPYTAHCHYFSSYPWAPPRTSPAPLWSRDLEDLSSPDRRVASSSVTGEHGRCRTVVRIQ